MTDSSASVTAHPSHVLDLSPETFWQVVVRRLRYTIAVLLSAWLFCTIGWRFAAPLPEMQGVSLLVWQNHGIFSAMILALLLLVATAVSSLLVHPDAPHMGLFCALLGMAGLSIRGGTIHMLIQNAMQNHTYPRTAQLLAFECVQWTLIFIIAEVFGRLLHDQFFANTQWITRTGPELTRDALEKNNVVGHAMGVSLSVSKTLRTANLRRRIAAPLAMIYSAALGFLLLFALLQSEAKSQVLVACFVAFFLSTLLAYLAFPRVQMLAFMLTVPLTAAFGYLYGMNASTAFPPTYPGHAAFFIMRALPIDYISAGVPGAILGYYAAFRWSLHSPEEQ